MTNTTHNWKYYVDRLSLDDVLDMPLRELRYALGISFFGIVDDSYVGLQLGPTRVGIEALGAERVSWWTPVRWLMSELRGLVPFRVSAYWDAV